MREVAVIGVGVHPWGKFAGKRFEDLGTHAIRAALRDASIQWQDVQAMVAGIYVWGGTDGLNSGPALAKRLGETGIPIVNVFNMCATSTSVFSTAYQMVASGEKDICLAVGVDLSPRGFFGFMGRPDPTDTDYLRFHLIGATNPAYWAMELRQRMELYGTTERHLALAKVAASKHGSLNPDALYRRVYTEEEVMSSPLVCAPLRLLEICATRDGAAAVVLCSAERARQLSTNAPRVRAASMGSSLYGDPTLRIGLLAAPSVGSAPMLSESYQAAQAAYAKAGVGPSDLDFVELPDNSSWHYLQYLETLGICGPGEAERLLEDGHTVIGGRIPVCPSGGASSHGEALSSQGLLQVAELAIQLRGTAGARQVLNAKVGLGQTYGQLGNSGTVILST